MGVSITCRKTGRTIDMGAGGFLRLRRKVSELQGGPFHDVYEEVCSWYPGRTAETADEFDARINARIEELLADEDKTKRPDIKIASATSGSRRTTRASKRSPTRRASRS